MARTLVIYFSRKGQNYWNGEIRDLKQGNTERVAEYIRDAVGADLFEVETVKQYPVDYTACTEEAQAEIRRHERPQLKRYLDDIAGYDNIVVAGPCWWGSYPLAILSQIERLDFTGKKVFPVMTHEGSGLAGSASVLRHVCKGAKVGEGLAIHGADVGSAEARTAAWAKRNLA